MDPDAFTAALFKWDPRGMIPSQQQQQQHTNGMLELPVPSGAAVRSRDQQLSSLEELFQAYGIRYYTGAKIAELGFTVTTLVNMKEEELDDMMNSVYHIFRWELLVGERYGIKAAVRAERRRMEELEEARRIRHFSSCSGLDQTNNAATVALPFDALSQEGLSEEGVQQDTGWVVMASEEWKKTKQQRRRNGKRNVKEDEDDGEEDDEEDDRRERSREHPFIVTEPGEVARGKKNGLDYLFHLYHLCADFLLQVQNLTRHRGEKCPTKVTNQVFRYAKKAGATYINKPKMRHYVHCYALHCLDEEASNALRRTFKERGENVGAWRQACYRPLVLIASHHSWDIDSIFNSHPRLSIWYVPTKLRQLCHFERSNAAAADAVSTTANLRFS